MEKLLKLKMIFDSLAEELNICETMYAKAVSAYTALGNYIKNNNEDWDVEVFPQGSFELGTVIKPISEEDQYDVDLVVLVKSPDFNEEELRKVIYRLLNGYGRLQREIEDKKPCIRIQYAESSQFHMDVACARPYTLSRDNTIEIAKYDGTNYYYDRSNPKGYIEWFKEQMAFKRLLQEHLVFAEQRGETNVEKLSLQKMKTPLQKAIQILKRHRDIYFQDNLDNRPSSIIITTLCAMTYDNMVTYKSDKENVYETINQTLEKIPNFIGLNSHGKYNLSNPTRQDENFLEKWNDNPSMRDEFVKWIAQAHQDIIVNPEQFIEDKPEKLNESMRFAFGERIGQNALNRYGEQMGLKNKIGEIKVDKKTMSTTLKENAHTITPKKNTFYGDK